MTIQMEPPAPALADEANETDLSSAAPKPRRRPGLVRRVAMRPRRLLVKVHRWLSIALLVWVLIIGVTGAWLVVNDGTGAILHPDRYRATDGDVGADAAYESASKALGDDATIWGVTLPNNGRGVYQVSAERPIAGAPQPSEAELAAGVEAPHEHLTLYVDPGRGKVLGRINQEAGETWWFYRGHMYLWQDHGIANAFHPSNGWCRTASGGEEGGAVGVVCDVMPDAMDLVGWLAAGFVVVLLTGFYLWYWPGVRRWANALVVKRGRGRFAFHLSLHKAVGLVFWVPLLVVAFTGMAFAFPNLKPWYENATPAARDAVLWEAPEAAWVSGAADGRKPIGLDGFIEVIAERYPERAVRSITPPADETGTYTAWVTRGFDPWTREGGAGNVYVAMDQYSGEVLYDGTPEDGNVFDQAWSDWSFPLHTGDFGGTATRLLWVVVGLAPIVLAVTGITMYLVRRAKRTRRTTAAATA